MEIDKRYHLLLITIYYNNVQAKTAPTLLGCPVSKSLNRSTCFDTYNVAGNGYVEQLLRPPTRVLLLNNMVGAGDVDEVA